MTVINVPDRPRFTTAALLVAMCAGVATSASYAQDITEPVAIPAPAVNAAPVSPAPATLPWDARPIPAQAGQRDYTQVVDIFANSIAPAHSEMGSAIKGFSLAMDQANALMDQDEYEKAIEVSLEAIDGMLALRDQIVDPLLDGREKMVAEIGPLRETLAKALLEAPADQRTGIDALDDRTRRALTQLAKQHRDATTDNARRLAEQKFRTKLRLAELRQRAQGSEQRITQVRRRLLERLDQMMAVLGELSINAEITFSSLDGQSKLLHQYRESLQLARTAQEAEAALNEAFGAMGFGGSLTAMEDQLMDFGTSIDDKLVAVLGSLTDTSSRTSGSSSSSDTAEIMKQLLDVENE